MINLKSYLSSSIGRKQVVAITGLMLIGFVIGHLAGNLIIYIGADAFNAYAKKLASLRPALYVVESGLLFIFLLHIWFITLLIRENIKARAGQYQVTKSSPQRSLATRLMPYSGLIVLAFVVWHLLDFTFTDKTGARAVIDGVNYNLYGVVVNSFRNPLHALAYVVAMISVGLHLSHGVESVFQTFGLNSTKSAPLIKKISHGFAIVVVLAYSSIPLTILFGLVGP